MPTTSGMLVKTMSDLTHEIESDTSWVDQARVATDAILELQLTVNRLAAIKAAAIRALFEEGWTVQQIGQEVGVSRARIHQIINR